MSFDSSFPFVTLKDVANFINGDRSTNYPKGADYIPNGIPFISAADLGEEGVDQHKVKRITAVAYERLRSGKIQHKDILFCLRGSIGKMAFVKPTETGAIASSLVIVRATPQIDSRYLNFLLCSQAGQQAAMSLNNGSAQPNLSVGQLQQISVPLPSLNEQIEISAMLGSLDDRISLLRESNATLEAIAQALFKSWFVDFDPVHANIARHSREGGNPDAKGSSEALDSRLRGNDETMIYDATARLFPDGFEESELGLVPRGWQVNSAYKVSTLIYGAPFASKKFNSNRDGVPLIRIRDLRDEAPGVFTPEVHPRGYMVQPGDLVVGMDGEFRAYLWGGEPAWLNQRVCVFTPKAGCPAAFVHQAIMPLLAEVEASETATTVIHLGKNDIDRFRILIPSETVLTAFGKLTDCLYSKIVNNKKSARTLATLRDTLLPRLISGQLRLPEGGGSK